MKRKSGFQIMKRLIGELKPLAPIMIITIVLGVLGFLAAISISSFAVIAIGTVIGEVNGISFNLAITVMIVCAILRGLLRYGEQLSGHYIAFKILYILRDKIFTKLRKLSPAKLEGHGNGSLISLITSDIELLEVFYAHTIAPISIAVITNTIISIVLFSINKIYGITSVIFFVIVGFIIPYMSSKMGREAGAKYRELFSRCNNYILDSLRGLKEIIFFGAGQERLEKINKQSIDINESAKKIKEHEGFIRCITDLVVMVAVLTFLLIGVIEFSNGNLSFTNMILGLVIIASSFGPVIALSNLSNGLLQTFAAAERLFSIMDEEPLVEEVDNGIAIEGERIKYHDVSFTYPDRSEEIFDEINIDIKKGDKIAITGQSGIGKSTFVKLLMRFWDVNKGSIGIDGVDLKEVNTDSLRRSQTLVSQETYLFNESIYENIKIGNKNASNSDIVNAAKKASIHDFIMSLPEGYNTKTGELGDKISSGEKQRIGLARAFVSGGDILILDEPTSNLDTLNEGEILKSIRDNCDDKTIILISHRESTSSICSKKYEVNNKKLVMNTGC